MSHLLRGGAPSFWARYRALALESSAYMTIERAAVFHCSTCRANNGPAWTRTRLDLGGFRPSRGHGGGTRLAMGVEWNQCIGRCGVPEVPKRVNGDILDEVVEPLRLAKCLRLVVLGDHRVHVWRRRRDDDVERV